VSGGVPWRLASALDSLRGRVLALLVLGAVPLIALALLVIWQDFRQARAEPISRVGLLRGAILASHQTALAGAEDVLAALARAPDLNGDDPAACRRFLDELIDLSRASYSNIGVVDRSGHMWCSVVPSNPGAERVATQDWFIAARDSDRFSVGGIAAGPDGAPAGVMVAMPLAPQPERMATAMGAAAATNFAGVVVAGLRGEWFAARILPPDPGVAAWLVDGKGGVLPIGAVTGSGTVSPAMPRADLLVRLLQAAEVLEARDQLGRLAAYAAAPVAGHLWLVIGQADQDRASGARWRLFWRGMALVGLVMAAFVLVATGAHAVVVAPVRRLGLAVQGWQSGSPFSPDAPPGSPDHLPLPAELRSLARRFATATARLTEREAELRRATERQDLLMQEIHHRVKNNLQIVASLLNLQANRIRLPEARAEFQSARDRVRALATLHRHLYVQGELHTINLRGFLVELCGQLFQAMGEEEGRRIALEIEAPELQMLSDQAVPLALIVTEAVGNALKYAFPDGRSGRICVRLEAEADSARLIVQDDGVGIVAGRVETESGTRDGLGLQLIRGFARQLGAVLTVDQGVGTRYLVEMPLRHVRPEEGAEAAL
jgi:two-component sensor histidine kinase